MIYWGSHVTRIGKKGGSSIVHGRQTESGLRLFSEIDKGIDKVLIRVAIRV